MDSPIHGAPHEVAAAVSIALWTPPGMWVSPGLHARAPTAPRLHATAPWQWRFLAVPVYRDSPAPRAALAATVGPRTWNRGSPSVNQTQAGGELFYAGRRSGDLVPMAARGHHAFTAEERALINRFIEAGEFRDEAEFEEFAIRTALAQLRLQELFDLRKASGARPMSRERILRETRKVRRQMWRERFPRDPGKKRKYAGVP